MSDSQALYECGFFSKGSGRLLNKTFKKLLVDLRPHMVPIVESIKPFSDHTVSVIGNKYGDIYDAQLERAK